MRLPGNRRQSAQLICEVSRRCCLSVIALIFDVSQVMDILLSQSLLPFVYDDFSSSDEANGETVMERENCETPFEANYEHDGSPEGPASDTQSPNPAVDSHELEAAADHSDGLPHTISTRDEIQALAEEMDLRNF